MDNRNADNCLETSYTMLNQQHRHMQVFISAKGTVGGPGPRASIMTNAGNKGSLLGQKQTPKRGCFPRCRPS